MKDMKLIMESWRRYSAPSSGIPMMIFENDKVEFFYLEEKISLLKESNRDSEIEVLFEKWLDQSEIILEIGVPKFIKDFVSYTYFVHTIRRILTKNKRRFNSDFSKSS